MTRRIERWLSPEPASMPGPVERAKQILTANEAVLYGAFGIVASKGCFPPAGFLNQFLAQGSDPCDQDGRMGQWTPLALSHEEYLEIKTWWIAQHPHAVENDLGTESWNDWLFELLER